MRFFCLVIWIVPLATTTTFAGEPPSQERISQLIKQLDAKTYMERQAASRQLRELCPAAMPQLIEAIDSKSLEVSQRAQDIVEAVRLKPLNDGFAVLARTPESKVDLEQGMFLIACIVNPACQRKKIDQQLDALATKVKAAFGERDPKAADPQLVVEKIVDVLFRAEGFGGNVENYSHPDNSSIERVLATRKGLPILLSHVVVSVAQRLDLPIVGVGVPRRYMAKYEGNKVPAGFPRKDVFMDSFGGSVIQQDDIAMVVGRPLTPEDLEPSSKTETLVRMLSNLSSHFHYVGDEKKAQLTLRYYELLRRRLTNETHQP